MSRPKLTKLFKDEDGRFLISCGIKFMGVFLLAATNLYYVIWNIISLNNIFLESKKIGLNAELREDFLNRVLAVYGENLITIFFFFIFLFVAGIYIGKVLLRPFELIGDYCEQKVLNKEIQYNPDLFSDYKLLTRFSEYFFSYLETVMQEKQLKPSIIPKVYTKIHAPPFEKVFFFHFFIINIMIAVFSVGFISYILIGLRESITEIYISLSKMTDDSVSYFLSNQSFVFDSILIYTSLIVVVGYVLLSFHLYSKTSGAIFAFFSTMRAFSKGSFSARVHLIGYAQIRPHGRKFNKYLDHVERECNLYNNEVEF